MSKTCAICGAPLNEQGICAGDIFKSCLRTSKDWLSDNKFIEIIDPDGWDRTNYNYSFNEELIDFEEFNRRIMNSTIQVI